MFCIDFVDEWRDATSAMSFRSPAMPMTSRGAEWHICWRSARALSRCPATNERAVNLTVQLTVDELSHWSPACTCWRDGTRCSRASQPSSTPAISRSLIEMWSVANALTTSGGKSTDQNTYLCVLSIRGSIQTPPAPYLHASVHPSAKGLSFSSPHPFPVHVCYGPKS